MTFYFADGGLPGGTLQWWVPVAGPFASISYNTGGGWTALTLDPDWLLIDDFIDALVDAVNTDAGTALTWAWTDSSGARRLAFIGDAGDPTVQLSLNVTLRRLLGALSGTVDVTAGDTIMLDTLPHGLLDVVGVSWSDAEPEREIHAATYRHNRGHTAPWGSGATCEVTVWVHGDQLDALLGGCCSVGRVRFTDGAPGYAMSTTAEDGWLDAYPYEVRGRRWLDDAEQLAEVRLGVMLPRESERTAALDAVAALGEPGFWAWLRTGLGIAHYARIEGIRRLSGEVDFGWTETGYTTATDLIIDDSGRVGWQLDRRRGVGAATRMSFGLLDPTNASGFFARGTTYTLAADVTPASTYVDVNEDITAAPSSGYLNIGKELVHYTGKSGTRFTGIDGDRGTWGPIYSYRVEAVQSFRSVCTWPRYWVGRHVELWAAMVDPWGQPFGTAYDGTWTRQVFLGELVGSPVPNAGRWDFDADSLERRLTRDVGIQSLAQLQGRLSDDPGDVLVWVEADAFYVRLKAQEFAGTQVIDTAQIATADGFMRAADLGQKIAQIIAGQLYTTALELNVTYIETQEPGDGSLALVLQLTDTSGWSGDGVVEIRSMDFASDGLIPLAIWPEPSRSEVVEPGATAQLVVTVWPGAPTRLGHWYARVQEPSQADWGNVALPTTGYLLIGSDPGELVYYTAKALLTGGTDNVYSIRITHRALTATERADLTERDVECKGGVLMELPPAQALLRLLESSGLAGTAGERGTYDWLDIGQGYGLADTYIDEASILALGAPMSLLGWMHLVLTDRYSVASIFDGILAAHWLSLGMVRSGRRLKIGLVSTRPTSAGYDHDLTDADLLSRDAAKVRRTEDGPTTVRCELDESSLTGGEKLSVTFRATEAVMARGEELWTLPFAGLTPGTFFSIIPALARGLVDRSDLLIGVELRAGPWRDYLPGQSVRITSTHPALWDYETGQMGVSEVHGRILGVERNLARGDVRLTVLLESAIRYGVLCPGVLVTGVSGDTLTVAAGDEAWFEDAEDLIIYTPGKGSEWTSATIDSISSGSIVLTGAAPGWVTANETRITYPDAGSGSARQDAYVHEDDGSTWE